MNINLHIERLILDGLPIESGQGGLVKAAVEAELSRLLEAHGLSASLQAGGAMPSLRASTVELNAQKNAAQIGQQIGKAVFTGIGETKADK
jgi:hypothetical protein